MMMSFFFFFFVLSMLYVVMNSKHFLNLLLIFEMVVVSLFLGLSYGFGVMASGFGLYFCVVFLTFAVCESVLGLSVVVLVSRFSGVGQVKPFSFLGF
uniref:NADH dehydrogenase subunit 4L n=1 Tax=Glauconome virens TaxID=457868 RepID=UPI00315C935C